MKVWLYLPLFVILQVTLLGPGYADEVEYLRDVKPLLTHKCAGCHGALKQQSGLRLDAGSLIRRGSDNGAVVHPGDSGESELIRRVTSDDSDRMPPAGQGEALTDAQVLLLSKWIDAGARVSEDEEVPTDPSEHWAYQIPNRPPVPTVTDSRWLHPIDAFISHEHQRLGLEPVQLADDTTLLRRVYFDLVGLPPSPEQLLSFLEEDSQDAWPLLIDSLLESQHYGERWGRHWMDVWRYSDWDGYKQELRGSQRHIWRWRDWIIDSLNADKGYDQMIVEMLAADEAMPDDPTALAATGFLARNFHKSNRNIWLDATVEHTAKAFLGLTINCARCHDHKYDPIPQLAYYQFRAVFEPHNIRTDQIPGQLDVLKDGLPRAFDADLAAETYLFQQGNDKLPDKDRPLAPAVPEVLGGNFEVNAISLPTTAYFPAIRDFVAQGQLDAARQQLQDAHLQLVNVDAELGDSGTRSKEKIELLERKRSVAQLRVYAIGLRSDADRAKYVGTDPETATDRAKQAALIERQLQTQELELAVQEKQQGLRAAELGDDADAAKKETAVTKAKEALTDAEQKLKKAKEALAGEPDSKYTPLGAEYPRTSTGRRLALAKWIANDQNPMTARVAVNHIWMRHFGAPLVDNVFDFGLRSPKPRHADLLDWLAVEFMENDWSMKHLHRLILTSRTWQLRSSADQATGLANRSLDRDNQYLWRMNIRRLDAEIIRDNVLAVAESIDPGMGGADIDFRDGEVSRRRSVYLRHAYEKQMTMLVLFDGASPNECYRRSESIVPQQALALSNSSFSLGNSRLLARRLWEEVGPDSQRQMAAFVEAAFLQVLSRKPATTELAVCLEFLRDQARILSDTASMTTYSGGSEPQVKPASDPNGRARENLVHVLMNHNDFVTVR